MIKENISQWLSLAKLFSVVLVVVQCGWSFQCDLQCHILIAKHGMSKRIAWGNISSKCFRYLSKVFSTLVVEFALDPSATPDSPLCNLRLLFYRNFYFLTFEDVLPLCSIQSTLYVKNTLIGYLRLASIELLLKFHIFSWTKCQQACRVPK